MPVATLPSSSTLAFRRYTRAVDIPSIAVEALEKRDVQSNPILPHLLKCRQRVIEDIGNLWFVLFANESCSEVLYVASCTRSPLGDYPLFIFTTIPSMELSDDLLAQDMACLCQWLKSSVDPARIYSVFAVARMSLAFVAEWSALTGIEAYSKPFYDCMGSFCTPRNLAPTRQNTGLSSKGFEYQLAMGTKGDIPEMAALCELFSEESVSVLLLFLRPLFTHLHAQAPFFMTPSQCREEAKLLVDQNAVWVHRIRRLGSNDAWEIASLAAVTRSTDKMATITKVVTSMGWRRLGCAERLTRGVCRE